MRYLESYKHAGWLVNLFWNKPSLYIFSWIRRPSTSPKDKYLLPCTRGGFTLRHHCRSLLTGLARRVFALDFNVPNPTWSFWFGFLQYISLYHATWTWIIFFVWFVSPMETSCRMWLEWKDLDSRMDEKLWITLRELALGGIFFCRWLVHVGSVDDFYKRSV